MVYLSRIYTKSGDAGDTGLGDGTRVAKDHPRVEAYGAVDELNSVLGVLLASCSGLDAEVANSLREIQNDLFDVGADLCQPEVADAKTPALRVQESQVTRLERIIDCYNEPLEPLRSFILPGGTAAAAWSHLARTICRRAERAVVTLQRTEPINLQALIYLNRLSDLLFVFGRVLNGQGKEDVLWVPGATRGQ
jgi:cob(I)alamin adenosyltransferase